MLNLTNILTGPIALLGPLKWIVKKLKATRSPAIVERPRDALYQLKTCQLLHSCT